MTTATTIQHPQREKFQSLLRDLFQFDSADLDFGIYRIMNHKRNVVERFIVEKLPETIDNALESGRFVEQQRNEEALEEVRQNVIAHLGASALDADDNLIAFEDTLIGQEYKDAQKDAEGARGSDAVEVSIYNHLYTFFSRYYDEGDFISKRRYSRNQRYAIPYNGEEVYLHWANSDQYYVKTDEHFKNYDWNAPNGVSVHFRVQDANVEQNNVQGDKRFFLPLVDSVAWDGNTRSIDIPFEYRPLNASEKTKYGRGNQQDKIIAAAVSAIPGRIGSGAPDAVSALVDEHRRDSKGEPVSRLEHHLRRYTQRNNADFFIHKDLKAFLLRELDFYLKNELLNLDEISAAGEITAEGWFEQMRLMKRVGGEIIEFLAQIEDFQKTLWEKKKFVVDTQYCVTLGNVPAEFHDEILENDAQWGEWGDLIGIDADDRCAEFLQSQPTLTLDTRYFSADFTDRLLASFDDLDGMTDGLLIHSENWQALRLLQEKYKSAIQCLYIDPPYNTGDSEILYKNGYLHSSWLSLMENRLLLTMGLLSDDPTAYIAIDDFQVIDLCELVDNHFPSIRREMIIVNHHPQGGKASTLSSTHEYMLACVDVTSGRRLTGRTDVTDIERRPFKRSGTAESNFRYARPNSFYAILIDPATNLVVGMEAPPPLGEEYPFNETDDGYIRIYPLGENGEERVWRRAYQSGLSLFQNNELESSSNGVIYHLISDKTPALFSNWTDSRYNAGTFGANLLGDIIGERNAFPYPKSVHTVGDAIFATRMDRYGYCLDYFAGSGTTAHAVINLNREDGGQRKFILVEMGEHFKKVLLPRVKKITYTPDWTEGKPKRPATDEEAERSPRVVKYMRLESYEDALDCIAFDANVEQMRLDERIEDYLIKYMLDMETRNSDTLLNVRKLTRPFSYKLRSHANGETREQKADIAETFNYLLGLNVRKRSVYDDDGRRYLVYRGETREAPGKEVSVVWRETEGWTEADYERDRDFVLKNKLTDGADTAYINGPSCIPGVVELEPLFRARMFAPVTA